MEHAQTEEILAQELLTRIQGEDATIDDLLALLAYAVHEETTPLIEAREEGADIGPVSSHAYQLKARCEDALC